MKCSNCETEFNEGIFCPECGTRVESNLENEVLKNVETSKETEGESRENIEDKQKEKLGIEENRAVFCLKCGEQIEAGLAFCPFCGYRVITDSGHRMTNISDGPGTSGNGTSDKKLGKRKQTKKKYIMMLLAAVGIIVVLSLFELISNRISTDTEEKKENIVAEKEFPDEKEISGDILVEEELEPIGEEVVATDTMVETDSLLQYQETEDVAIEENQFDTVADSDYEKWIGGYVRTSGPSSGIEIWSVDDNGILFAAGIGCSGYLAYRDIRDCNAEWVDGSTAVYVDEDGGRMELALQEDGTLVVCEERSDAEDILLLSGTYKKSFGQSTVKYEYVLPDSDKRRLTESDLENLNPLECKIARNEIYARCGRLFTDEQLQNYFDCCTWYNGEMAGENFSLDMLSDIERENAEFISEYEEKMGYK